MNWNQTARIAAAVLSGSLALSASAFASPPIKVGVYNQSSLSDTEVTANIAAMQVQIDRDFAPYYRDAVLLQELTPRPAYRVFILDGPVKAPGGVMANGFHWHDPHGPYAKVSTNCPLSICGGHELMEMLSNPNPSANPNFVEICDGLKLSYWIEGLPMVDFRLPPKLKNTWCGGNPGICHSLP